MQVLGATDIAASTTTTTAYLVFLSAQPSTLIFILILGTSSFSVALASTPIMPFSGVVMSMYPAPILSAQWQ